MNNKQAVERTAAGDLILDPAETAPPAPPLPDIALMWDTGEKKRWWRYALTAVIGAAAGVAAMGWLN